MVVVEFSATHGTNNFLLGFYLIVLFLFWLLVLRITPQYKYDKNNLVNTFGLGMIKLNAMLWIVTTFYVFFLSILLISNGDTFLTDKISIFMPFMLFSGVSLGIALTLWILKAVNRYSGFEALMRDLGYEIKTGGKR